MPFWPKEREPGVWDFKGKAGNLQVDEKKQTQRGKQILAGPPRNNGTQEVLTNRLCWISPCRPHLV